MSIAIARPVAGARCRVRSGHFARSLLVFTAIIGSLAVASLMMPAGAQASVTDNAVCTRCHEAGEPGFASADTEVDFSATAVDKSACNGCHWTRDHFDHGSNKEGCTCHTFSYPATRDLYVASISTPYGYFTSADSVDLDAAKLHDIHVNGSWPRNVTKNMAGLAACKSCHAPAACDACHSYPDGHGSHGTGDHVAYRATLGAPQGTATGADTTYDNDVSCSTADCHATAKAEDGAVTTKVNHTSAVIVGSYQRTADFTSLRATTSKATFTISGEGDLTLYNYEYVYGAIARVTVDGGTPVLVDTYAMNGLYNIGVVAARDLAPRTHTVLVENTGLRNPAAMGARVNVMSVRMSNPVADAGFKPECVSCHAEKLAPHPDPAAHDGTLDAPCDGCHQAALLAEHASRTDDQGLPVGCATCHANQRADVDSAVRNGDITCVACHSLDHADLHANTWTTCAGVDCHNGVNLITVHEALTCETCHASADAKVTAAIAANDKNCPTCHNPMLQHGAAHEASATFANYVMFPGTVGTGGPSYLLKCLSCHRSNLLSSHGSDYTNCSMCHLEGGPRSSFTTWDTTCQTGECHPTAAAPHLPPHTLHYHNRMSYGAQPEGMCPSCHANPVGWQCGSPFGCHTGAVPTAAGVDFTAPTTVASRISEEPIAWKLLATDAGDGVAETYYSFDGGPWILYTEVDAANGIVNPADAEPPYLHTLRYYSVDAAGHVEAVQTKDYDVKDNTPPVITFNGLNGTTTTKSLTMSVSDPKVNGLNSGVASIQMETVVFYRWWNNWVGNGGVMPAYRTLGCSASYPLDASWDSTRTVTNIEAFAGAFHSPPTQIQRYIYPTGDVYMFYLRYTATDYAGNQSTPVETPITIDNGPPTTTTASAGTYRWKLNVTDNGSGLDKSYYSFDGAAFAEYTAADHTAGIVNTQPGGTDPGTHTLRYYSVDKLGNTEAIKTLDYTIP